MAEIVGSMTCPVCGEEHQDVKVNKNGKLYMYCDNGCMVRLSSKLSRCSLPLLKQKKAANTNKLRIQPVCLERQTPNYDCGSFAAVIDDDDDF